MTSKIKIDGFKCFSGEEFSINQITVLSGSNGSGKSSLIQCILLIRSAIELSCQIDAKGSHYDLKSWTTSRGVPLNDSYDLSLGTVDDIINSNLNNNSIQISFGETKFEIAISDNPDNFVYVKLKGEKKFQDKYLTKKEFYYLNAERIGPRYFLDSKFVPYDSCGSRGEFTADVISKKVNSFFRVDKERTFILGNTNFQIQLDSWINYIFPDSSISTSRISNLQAQIKIRNQKNNVESVATNIGFGISYALPIIVTGLIAERGSTIIIENPEAHLHPKAQSHLGYFLFRMSQSDIKIIVETHSEHLINGIRRAALEKENASKGINIYFFDGYDQEKLNYNLIWVSDKGSMSSFPRDFFDQVAQDMSELFKLKKSQTDER